jgi:hypothetical protein
MPLFEIYFHGLICFYGPGDRFGRRDSDTSVSRSTIEVKPGNAIILALPAGDLHAATLYPYKGQFYLDQTVVRHAVCRISLLTVNTPNLTFYLDGAPVVVTGDPWALLYNGSTDGGDGLQYNHFHRYAYITGGRLEDLAEVTDVKAGEPDPANPGEKFPYDDPVTDQQTGKFVGDVIALVDRLSRPAPDKPVINQTQCGNTQWP